jgi:hypothetical protein
LALWRRRTVTLSEDKSTSTAASHVRETKLAAVRRFTGQWGAPTFLIEKEDETKDKENKAPNGQNGFDFSNRTGHQLTQHRRAASGTPELSSITHNPQPPVCQTRRQVPGSFGKTKTRPGNTTQSE